MKTGPRSPAVSAALWAIGLCAGYVFGPLLLQIGAATGVSEKDLAMRLISAAFLFPLLFLGLWVYEKKKGKQHLANVYADFSFHPGHHQRGIRESVLLGSRFLGGGSNLLCAKS